MIKRSNKYSNHKVDMAGIKFDSKKEAARYRELQLLEKAGVVADIELQPKYRIVINDRKVCDYTADFRYIEEGKTIVEDVKGYKTPVYNLKKKLMAAVYGIEIRET